MKGVIGAAVTAVLASACAPAGANIILYDVAGTVPANQSFFTISTPDIYSENFYWYQISFDGPVPVVTGNADGAMYVSQYTADNQVISTYGPIPYVTQLTFDPTPNGYTGSLQPLTRLYAPNGSYTQYSVVAQMYFHLNDAQGDRFHLTVYQVAAVPESSTWAMMLIGFGLAGGVLRKRLPHRSPVTRLGSLEAAA